MAAAAGELNCAHRPGDRVDALPLAGVGRDNIRTNTVSGAKASRPKPDLVLQLPYAGDTLRVTGLDLPVPRPQGRPRTRPDLVLADKAWPDQADERLGVRRAESAGRVVGVRFSRWGRCWRRPVSLY
ncbi:hypothetical protein [Streptomyces sp. NPDC059122]|uniref:hypothetical protein n=1 Tax=unclassified Streptomyces TaxID=2593676 RepID=UPI0036998CAC